MILLLLFILHLSSNIAALSIPLAVRSPYLNCWLHSNGSLFGYTWTATPNRSQVCHLGVFSWPQGTQLLSDPRVVCPRESRRPHLFVPREWSFDLVNGTVFRKGYRMGPASTTISGDAGPMRVSLDFVNPIEVCFHPSIILLQCSHT